jgi:hypothetical protein
MYLMLIAQSIILDPCCQEFCSGMSVEQTSVHTNATDFNITEVLAVCTCLQEVDIAKQTEGDCNCEQSP